LAAGAVADWSIAPTHHGVASRGSSRSVRATPSYRHIRGMLACAWTGKSRSIQRRTCSKRHFVTMKPDTCQSRPPSDSGAIERPGNRAPHHLPSCFKEERASAHVADALRWLVPMLRVRTTGAARIREKDVSLHMLLTHLPPICWVPDIAWAVGAVGRRRAVDGWTGRECQTVAGCLRKDVRVDGVVNSCKKRTPFPQRFLITCIHPCLPVLANHIVFV
jgi:hypothetical protein